jgi:hypothetical protein
MKKYRCPFCEDFETESKEYLEYHWTTAEECCGPDEEDFNG